MKKYASLILAALIIVLTVAFFFAKDLAIKFLIEKGIETFTGLDLEIGDLRVSLLRTSVDFRDITLHNPKGFEEETMFVMPNIYINYDLPAAIKGRVHLREMRIEMSEFSVVKNRMGENNINLMMSNIKRNMPKAPSPGRETEAAGKEGRGFSKIHIDVLELKLGRVTFEDYSTTPGPTVKEFKLNIDERYENISDGYTFVSLIILRALRNTTIQKILNLDLGTIGDTVKVTVRRGIAEGRRILGHTEKILTDTTESLGRKLKEIIPLGLSEQQEKQVK